MKDRASAYHGDTGLLHQPSEGLHKEAAHLRGSQQLFQDRL